MKHADTHAYLIENLSLRLLHRRMKGKTTMENAGLDNGKKNYIYHLCIHNTHIHIHNSTYCSMCLLLTVDFPLFTFQARTSAT